MKNYKRRVVLLLASVVPWSLILMTNTANAEETEQDAGPSDAPKFVERQIVAKAPAPSYSKDGALLDVICNLRLDYPHSSSHVDGTVNVVSQVSCNTPVSAITLLLQLYYNGSVANSNINENYGSASLYNQVAAPCLNGGWQAHAEALVNFPPGVTPPSAYEAEDTPPISIDCSL